MYVAEYPSIYTETLFYILIEFVFSNEDVTYGFLSHKIKLYGYDNYALGNNGSRLEVKVSYYSFRKRVTWLLKDLASIVKKNLIGFVAFIESVKSKLVT